MFRDSFCSFRQIADSGDTKGKDDIDGGVGI